MTKIIISEIRQHRIEMIGKKQTHIDLGKNSELATRGGPTRATRDRTRKKKKREGDETKKTI